MSSALSPLSPRNPTPPSLGSPLSAASQGAGAPSAPLAQASGLSTLASASAMDISPSLSLSRAKKPQQGAIQRELQSMNHQMERLIHELAKKQQEIGERPLTQIGIENNLALMHLAQSLLEFTKESLEKLTKIANTNEDPVIASRLTQLQQMLLGHQKSAIGACAMNARLEGLQQFKDAYVNAERIKGRLDFFLSSVQDEDTGCLLWTATEANIKRTCRHCKDLLKQYSAIKNAVNEWLDTTLTDELRAILTNELKLLDAEIDKYTKQDMVLIFLSTYLKILTNVISLKRNYDTAFNQTYTVDGRLRPQGTQMLLELRQRAANFFKAVNLAQEALQTLIQDVETPEVIKPQMQRELTALQELAAPFQNSEAELAQQMKNAALDKEIHQFVWDNLHTPLITAMSRQEKRAEYCVRISELAQKFAAAKAIDPLRVLIRLKGMIECRLNEKCTCIAMFLGQPLFANHVRRDRIEVTLYLQQAIAVVQGLIPASIGMQWIHEWSAKVAEVCPLAAPPPAPPSDSDKPA